ncbi:hypothetical protein BDK51DRAFT_32206 [Blyttiomyces helicus]|uniref:Brr2 N-terminal helicase PWI domain-containing protein n=1 Tax=Blyttiomyces helicus TaxID=388810 RepID=A0A4P9W572_9FUNG|nr:hypothetical protein BDK51DRAFT_32206 [Blyttiomyces helicus]|eukprot:RKO87541.1 hypothetical protein BDK51DRAFT_32206 [Blyttiomyces helicus]
MPDCRKNPTTPPTPIRSGSDPSSDSEQLQYAGAHRRHQEYQLTAPEGLVLKADRSPLPPHPHRVLTTLNGEAATLDPKDLDPCWLQRTVGRTMAKATVALLSNSASERECEDGLLALLGRWELDLVKFLVGNCVVIVGSGQWMF